VRVASIAVIVALSLTSCSKKDEVTAAATEPSETPTPSQTTTAAEPFTGTLTEELLAEAKEKVKPFMKWEEAEAALLPVVGKATGVVGKEHFWAFVDGDKCHALQLENSDGEVGAVQLGSVDKMAGSMFDKCAQGAGTDPATDDDGEGGEDGREAEPVPSDMGGEPDAPARPVPSTTPGRPRRAPPKKKSSEQQAPDDEDDDPFKSP